MNLKKFSNNQKFCVEYFFGTSYNIFSGKKIKNSAGHGQVDLGRNAPYFNELTPATPPEILLFWYILLSRYFGTRDFCTGSRGAAAARRQVLKKKFLLLF